MFFQFEVGDLGAVFRPFDLLVLDQRMENMLAESVFEEFALFGDLNGLTQTLRKRLQFIVEILLRRFRQLPAVFDAFQSRRQHDGKSQIGVAGRVRQA